jgi:hypothetical protein
MLPVKCKSSGEAADATANDDDAMDLLLHGSSLLLLASGEWHPYLYIGC